MRFLKFLLVKIRLWQYHHHVPRAFLSSKNHYLEVDFCSAVFELCVFFHDKREAKFSPSHRKQKKSGRFQFFHYGNPKNCLIWSIRCREIQKLQPHDPALSGSRATLDQSLKFQMSISWEKMKISWHLKK